MGTGILSSLNLFRDNTGSEWACKQRFQKKKLPARALSGEKGVLTSALSLKPFRGTK